MEKEKCFSNKVSSPEEFFQLSHNLLRKQKTIHRLFKPSSIFWFHNPHEKINQFLTDTNQCLNDIFKI